MNPPKKQFQKFIIPLYFFMQLSRKAYANYLNNKIYGHAQAIRKANRKIYKLLTEKPDLIPDDLKPDMIALLNHYDIWFAQFKELKKKNKPQPEDEFIFQQLDSQSAFPKMAEEKVFGMYEKMKSLTKKEIAG